MCMLPTCMPVFHLHPWCPQKLEDCIISLRIGHASGCEVPYRCWELNFWVLCKNSLCFQSLSRLSSTYSPFLLTKVLLSFFFNEDKHTSFIDLSIFHLSNWFISGIFVSIPLTIAFTVCCCSFRCCFDFVFVLLFSFLFKVFQTLAWVQ